VRTTGAAVEIVAAVGIVPAGEAPVVPKIETDRIGHVATTTTEGAVPGRSGS
jgi:hypothetical protein